MVGLVVRDVGTAYAGEVVRGIDLELGVWINDPEEGHINLISDLNLAIWRAFSREGIEIPYPQREIRMIGEGGK